MLTHLSIRNFTLVNSLDLELDAGMTAITGETGAGKSIVLGALGQALGDRTDSSKVRSGAERADITAEFDLGQLPAARRWLAKHELNNSDEANTEEACLLRRVITAEGRSRAFINGQPVTLSQLKALGDQLIDLHSQHEHQSLLKKDTHRRLLDDFAGHQSLAATVKECWQQWQDVQQRLDELRNQSDEISARQQLLSYQVQELDQLALEAGELAALESEQRTLANAGSILEDSHNLASLCNDDEQGLLAGLGKAVQLLADMPEKTSALNEAEQLLQSARIQVEEARSEIDHHIDHFEIDPLRLQAVEERLSTIYEVARKHRVQAEALCELHEGLRTELSALSGGDESIEGLEIECEKRLQQYQDSAAKLSNKRESAAKKLTKAVNSQLKSLAMSNANLHIALKACEVPARNGLEDIEFLISTNPGQPHQALAKIASGGELSRISLAIQVVTAKTSATPTMVFDEVDVGIGGATADTVGKLLRELGDKGQVICVTHLPQVASKAHQHLQATKATSKKAAQSMLLKLQGETKIQEIARMLGGADITEQSIAHAEEMLSAKAG